MISNVVKYDGKTNPSIWLEDYCDKPMTHNFNSYVHAQNSENISAPLSSKQNMLVCARTTLRSKNFCSDWFRAGASADFTNLDELASYRNIILFYSFLHISLSRN
jgi:hypothetical protein